MPSPLAMDQNYEPDEKSTEQHQRLLKHNDHEQQQSCSCQRPHQQSGYPRSSRIALILISVSIFLVYSIALSYVSATRAITERQPTEEFVIPSLRKAIQHEVIPLVPDDVDNPYAGDPRPEHDKAWSELMENIHIRFTEEEMRQVNKTSLQLNDGGYMVQLGAYHELHCVKWIRKWIHRDHYWPYLSEVMLNERKIHIEHCLELMRLKAMCRASTDITTFEWVGSQPKPVSNTQQKCVNWESFDAWNHERRVSLADLNIFKDRPKTQDWEIADDAVRLGSKKGDTKGFESLLKGEIIDEKEQ